MKEIERAIELITAHLKITEQFLENSNPKTTNVDVLKDIEDDKKDVISYNLTIQCLKSELNRQKNKPLKIKQLQDMINNPIWVVEIGDDQSKAKCVVLSKINRRNSRYEITDTTFRWRLFDNFNWYEHKPKGYE